MLGIALKFGCVSAFFTTILLFYISLDYLEATEMAIIYDSIYLRIDKSELHSAGIHFVGPGRSFIRYPKAQQEVTFPSEDGYYNLLTTRSKDGLKVELQIAFQYVLAEDVESLAELYYLWGPPPDCFDAFKMIARSALRDVAARYDAYDFFANRTMVEEEMSIELSPQIEVVGGVLDTFQLLDVFVDKQFDAALQETEVVRQAIVRAYFQQQDQEVVAAARVDRVNEEAEVIVNEKTAFAKLRENDISFQRQKLEASMKAELNAFVDLQRETGMNGQAVLNYVWTHGVQESETTDNSMIGIASPSDVKCFASPLSCEIGPMEDAMQYSCTVGSQCMVTVHGSSLSTLDAVRIAKSDCATASTNWPLGLSGKKIALDSKPTDKKGFDLGVPAETGSFRLCYCAWSKQVLGCDGDEAFADAGLLAVA
jgi:hypothetical protein